MTEQLLLDVHWIPQRKATCSQRLPNSGIKILLLDAGNVSYQRDVRKQWENRVMEDWKPSDVYKFYLGTNKPEDFYKIQAEMQKIANDASAKAKAIRPLERQFKGDALTLQRDIIKEMERLINAVQSLDHVSTSLDSYEKSMEFSLNQVDQSVRKVKGECKTIENMYGQMQKTANGNNPVKAEIAKKAYAKAIKNSQKSLIEASEVSKNVRDSYKKQVKKIAQDYKTAATVLLSASKRIDAVLKSSQDDLKKHADAIRRELRF